MIACPIQPTFKDALENPSLAFPSPEAVIDNTSFSNAQKREILESWEAEAIHLQESESEGFGGGERSQLDDVKRALDALD